ncbi:MAG TPA: oligosaccharide flippase family protein [Candidatus Woesebacteria bacterium]|nr:oligosaccharide flippase family protein [Candidatus Woesebacteria bacterium]HQO51518.1 oligosaccharide flippase family protein [Candidatus Woesebacteria bacterium]
MLKAETTQANDRVDETLAEDDLKAIKKKSLTGVISFFIRTIILQAIGLLSALILSVFLGPEDFGIYGIVTQIIALLIFFSDIGLASSLIQKKEEPTQEDYQTAFTVQQILSWFIFLLVLLLIHFGVFEQKIGRDGNWLLLALAISFPLATLKTIPSIILTRKLEFNKLIVPQIFEQLVFHAILIVLAWRGHGVLSYAYASIARSLIGVLVMQIIQPWISILGIHRKSLKSLLNFGVKFQLNDFLARIKDQLYFLALGAYLPLDQFGYLQWSKNWSMYPYNLTVSNVMSVTFPTFSRLQAHPEVLKKAIEKSIYFISLAIFPILIGMSLFIQPLIMVFERYSKWAPAVPSFIMFTLSVLWAAISTPLLNALNAIGKINQTLKLMLFWTILTWVLTPILIWLVGFNGVALAALLISFTSILSVILVKKYVPVDIWQNVNAQLAASFLMVSVGILGMSVWRQSLAKLFLGVALCAVTYLASFYLIAGKRLLREIRSIRNNL